MIDERTALDPAWPLARALDFWRRLDGTSPVAQGEALERLGLAGLGDVPVRYLSTGQKKRAALVRLLGQNAPVWLLDEPLNGLDTAGVALVGALCAEHAREGGALVVASHQAFPLPALAALDLARFAA